MADRVFDLVGRRWALGGDILVYVLQPLGRFQRPDYFRHESSFSFMFSSVTVRPALGIVQATLDHSSECQFPKNLVVGMPSAKETIAEIIARQPEDVMIVGE